MQKLHKRACHAGPLYATRRGRWLVLLVTRRCFTCSTSGYVVLTLRDVHMLQGNVEGVKLSQCDFVAVQHGVFAEKCLQLNVVNSHINASHGGILARNVNQSSFSNLLIYKVGFHLTLITELIAFTFSGCAQAWVSMFMRRVCLRLKLRPVLMRMPMLVLALALALMLTLLLMRVLVLMPMPMLPKLRRDLIGDCRDAAAELGRVRGLRHPDRGRQRA